MSETNSKPVALTIEETQAVSGGEATPAPAPQVKEVQSQPFIVSYSSIETGPSTGQEPGPLPTH